MKPPSPPLSLNGEGPRGDEVMCVILCGNILKYNKVSGMSCAGEVSYSLPIQGEGQREGLAV